MLGDDSREKEIFRNQLIAIGLMTLLMVVWLQYFMPPPPVQQPQDAPGTEPAVTRLAEEDTLATSGLPAAPDRPETIDLAPAGAPDAPIDDEVMIASDRLRLVFTRVGARLKQAEVLLDSAHGSGAEPLVPQPPAEALDSEVVYPLGIGFSNEAFRDRLNRVRWDLARHDEREAEFVLTLPDVAEIRKTYRFADDRPHVFELEVSYTELSGSTRRMGIDLTPAYVVSWAPNVDSHDENIGIRQAVLWRVDDATELFPTAKIERGRDGQPFQRQVRGAEWSAIKSAYYVVGLRPLFEESQSLLTGDSRAFSLGFAVPRFEAVPGERYSHRFELYIGPNAHAYLSNGWDNLTTAQRFFEWPNIMDTFAKFLLRGLNWIEANIYASYGLAIILLTVVVRVLMIPLTLKQVKSMKRMQMVAPELEEIRKQHADDPQVQQQKMMQLYRERGVNPFGGCLPLLVQMPIFIALYRMLWSAYELRGAPFLWIEDLSEPDRLFRIPGMDNLPLIGDFFAYLNILPILGAIAMILSVRLMPQTSPMMQQQKVLMTILPVGFSLIFYNWAAGLNLYVLTSTVLGIVQTHLTRVAGKDMEVEVKKPKPKRKRKHFYAAAQARKRRISKEVTKGNGAKSPKGGAQGRKRADDKTSRKDS